MMRSAISVIALAVASMVSAGPAHAQRGGFHHDGFHNGFRFHDGFRFRRDFDHRRFFFHPFFFRHSFFRPFFFFGAPVFAPIPVALYPPMPYPSYLTGPSAAGGSCYQYQTSIMMDGQIQPAWGTACQQPDGSWRIVG